MQMRGFKLLSAEVTKEGAGVDIYEEEGNINSEKYHIHCKLNFPNVCDQEGSVSRGIYNYVDLNEYFKNSKWKAAVDEKASSFKFLGPKLLDIVDRVNKASENSTGFLPEEIFSPKNVFDLFYSELELFKDKVVTIPFELKCLIQDVTNKYVKDVGYCIFEKFGARRIWPNNQKEILEFNEIKSIELTPELISKLIKPIRLSCVELLIHYNCHRKSQNAKIVKNRQDLINEMQEEKISNPEKIISTDSANNTEQFSQVSSNPLTRTGLFGYLTSEVKKADENASSATQAPRP